MNSRQPRNSKQLSEVSVAHSKFSGTISLKQYAAPGDEPMAIASQLQLQQPFNLNSRLATQLERREVNPKEAFTIRDSSGTYFRASLKELSDGGQAVPYERMHRSPEPVIDITLACAVLGRQRMIFVMQKATELGVASIVPLLTEHSVPLDGLEHEKAHSWPGQIIRAARQCRRSSLPAIHPVTELKAFLGSVDCTSADARVMLDDRSDPTSISDKMPKRVVLFVGPEGGFSDAERTLLASSTEAWVLGGRVLRAETAVIVGLSAVQMRWGDFSKTE